MPALIVTSSLPASASMSSLRGRGLFPRQVQAAAASALRVPYCHDLPRHSTASRAFKTDPRRLLLTSRRANGLRVHASASSIDKLPGALDSGAVVSVNRKMGEGSFGQVFEVRLCILPGIRVLISSVYFIPSSDFGAIWRY